jgi:PAS domain S-box-containing protein
MTWNYDFTASTWPSVLTLLLLIWLAVYSWRRRSVPGALPFAAALLFAALWVAGSILEYAAVDVPAKIQWVKFQAAWHLPTATAITGFILDFVWPGRWLTRRHLALVSAPALLVIALIATNNLHHLMWRGFEFSETIMPTVGPAGWAAIAFGYSFIAVNFIALAWLLRRSREHRWFVVAVLAGQVAVYTVYGLEKSHALQLQLPLDVFGIGLAYISYAVALFGFRVLDPVPLGRRAAIEQLPVGVLILDRDGRVASVNPAAQQFLGSPFNALKGRPFHELAPACPEDFLDAEEAAEFELSLGPESEARDHTATSSPLKDWRGLAAGWLVMLRNVTAQKRAQAQIVEQQRALAMLKEREQVARELHDQLSQGVALINVQAQVVSSLLEANQPEQAQAQLQLLACVARETQADVRGEIRTLSLDIAPGESFAQALRRQVETFGLVHGVRAQLVLPEAHATISFAPTVEVQLLRIVQEALTNIRKHARATGVQVAMTPKTGGVVVAVEDDGIGFDPDRPPAPGQAFGLRIMSERAAEINAQVEIKTAPGQGTRIEVHVPAGMATASAGCDSMQASPAGEALQPAATEWAGTERPAH